jgi:hypothetical protein
LYAIATPPQRATTAASAGVPVVRRPFVGTGPARARIAPKGHKIAPRINCVSRDDVARIGPMSRSEPARTIIGAKARPPATLVLRWSDGTRANIDLSAMLHERDFRRLRGRLAFGRVRVGDWGHSVEWASGAELSAERLWLETLTARGRQDTRAFLEWRLRHGLSLTKAAEALGVSRRMVA